MLYDKYLYVSVPVFCKYERIDSKYDCGCCGCDINNGDDDDGDDEDEDDDDDDSCGCCCDDAAE
mgnify:CR=1 FL=1